MDFFQWYLMTPTSSSKLVLFEYSGASWKKNRNVKGGVGPGSWEEKSLLKTPEYKERGEALHQAGLSQYVQREKKEGREGKRNI